MEHSQIEVVGKVFQVVGEKRRCLICEGMFTPAHAANHAKTLCCPSSPESEPDEGTLDPCSPSLSPIDFSCSQGQA